MPLIGQVVVNGLVLGITYALVALGFTLVFSVMGIVNIAHTDLYMLGGFMVFYLYGILHINYFLVLVIVAVSLAAVGILMEKALFRPIRGQPFYASMIISMGLSFLIEGGGLLAFGEREKGVPSPVSGVIRIGLVSFGAERLFVVSVALVLLLALYLFLTRVKYGQAMRALSQDAVAAYLQGININRTSMLAFAISIALAGISGALLTPLSFVSYSIGSYLILKCFLIVVIGGIGSLPGCLVGGLILGFMESVSLTYLPGNLSYMIMFAVVLVVLLVRPQGVMGRAELA